MPATPSPRHPLGRGLMYLLLPIAAACSTPGAADTGGTDTPAAPAARPRADKHPVDIHIPDALRGIATGKRDPMGRPVLVPCGTCHADATPRPDTTARGSEAGPHRGLKLVHGGLRCAGCHDAERGDRLHLADGRSLPMTEAMTLCSQCHGPQARDYAHGSHGGMAGHWDLTRGPRVRNHCIDCHDPHAPAYPKFMPAPPPPDPHAANQPAHADTANGGGRP